MKTVGDVLEKARAYAEGNFDFVSPCNELDFAGGNVVHSSRTYGLMNWSRRQLLARLRIPAEYFARCPDYLQDYNVSSWLSENGDTKWLVRTDEDKMVYAILSSRYEIYDNARFLEVVANAIGEDAHYLGKVAVTHDFMSVEVMFSEINTEDGTYGYGVKVFNGMSGNSRRGILPLIQRGRCTNSIVAGGEGWIRRHYGAKNSQAQIEDMTVALEIARCLRFGPEMVQRMLASYQVSVPKFSEVVKSISDQLELDEDQRIKFASGTEASETLGGIVNGLTALANSLGPVEALRLQGIAGNYLFGKKDDFSIADEE